MNEGLIDALGAREGIVCLIGAGGKKTTMARLAWLQADRSVGLSTTVFCAHLPAWLAHEVRTGDPAALAALTDEPGWHPPTGPLAFFGAPTRPDRHTGLPGEAIVQLHQHFRRQVTLVKADGARMRRIKAPGPGEPVLPPRCDRVIAVLSIRALGRPLDERVAHRPERVSEATGLAPNEPLREAHLARLFTSEHGLPGGVDGPPITPLINMVDHPESRHAARRVAEQALADCRGRFDRVVLASMRSADPLVDIIRA